MQIKTENIQAIIWDLDNTLYRFTDDFVRSCNEAAAKAAQEQGITLSYEDTLKLAERSEVEHGYSMHGYVTDHGLSYASLHFPFHDNIDEKVIEPIAGMHDALVSIKFPQAIVTNASRGWAERVLKYCGLDDLFEENMIVPMEDVNFKAKAQTDAAFIKTANIMNVANNKILMVDDLDRNLIFPNKLGMQTAFMNHNDPMKVLPAYVDGQFQNPIALIKELF